MSMAEIIASLSVSENITLDQGSILRRHLVELKASYNEGTGSGEVDEVWSDERTVNAGADDDLELDNLTQVDADDATVRTVAFAKVKGIFIRKITATDYLKVGAAGATAFAGADDYPFADDTDIAQVVGENGLFLWLNPEGATVGNGTADVLRISGVTTNQTYQIVIIGVAA